jgi:hypothetical protein
MADTGAEVTRAEDSRAGEPVGGDTGTGPGSRLEQYRNRIEEWASALRDGAEQHAPPEVLSGLATAARNVALYLDGMAERARVRQAKEEAPAPKPTEQSSEPPDQAERASQG